MVRTGSTLEVADFVRRYDEDNTVGPVSFTVAPGVCFGLVGANGAGKTTLMRSILGLDRPTSGSVTLDGTPVDPRTPCPAVSGMIEESSFFGWLSAADNLRAAFAGRDLPDGRQERALREVGLGEVGAKRVRGFSQGMRQRLAIARVLAADPDVLVLDEPTNGLDPLGIQWLRGLVRGLVAEGRSVILSSHLLHEVQETCSEFLLIDRGRVVTAGPMALTEGHGSLEAFYLSFVGDGEGPSAHG